MYISWCQCDKSEIGFKRTRAELEAYAGVVYPQLCRGYWQWSVDRNVYGCVSNRDEKWDIIQQNPTLFRWRTAESPSAAEMLFTQLPNA